MSYSRLKEEGRGPEGSGDVLRIASQGALRQNLESYQNQHKAGNFAIEVDKSLKRKRRASLQDFADKIKLGHENYSPNVPASVHGAPQNEEESKEILERLNRMSAFEGQDYDKNENDISRAAQLNRDELDYANEEAWKWILAFMVGVTMGVLMFIVDVTLEGINTLKFGTVKRLIASTGGFWVPYIVLLCFNMGFAAISGYIVAYEAPFAAGSGIPELKSYLNGIHLRGFLSMRTFVCKFIGVITCIAAGLVSSKGGPLIHLGSIVGGGLSGMGSNTLSQIFKRPIKAPRKYGGYFRNDAEHRDYVSIGAAAGITTSFSAPLGGLLLAVEEHSSFYNTNIFWRGFVATCTAVTVLHVLAQLRLHPWAIFESKFGIRRDYGLYDDNKALYGKVYFYYLWELPIYAAMGIFGACMGVLFIKLNITVSRLRGRFIPVLKRRRRIAEVVTIAWLTTTIFFLACWVGECKPLPSARHLSFYEMDGEDQDILAGVASVDPSGLKHFPRLWCAPDHYNENGRLFLNPLVQALRTIYHFGETLPAGLPDSAGLTWDLLALWAMIIFPLSILSAGMAATTGLFMPWLSVGAAWGRLTGLIITALAKNMGSSLPISLSAYTVIGASAQLTGITRNILAMAVLTMESTGSLQLIVPIMVAVFAAKMTGDALSLGFYEVQIKIRGAPTLLEPNLKAHQAMVSDKLHVHEVMTTQLLAVAPVGKVKDLVDVLQRCKHQAFPVTPDVSGAWQSGEAFPLHGMLRRTLLLRLLKYRIGIFAWDGRGPIPLSSSQVAHDQQQRWEVLEKLEQIPLKIRPHADQEQIIKDLTDHELEMHIDLRPYMQRAPFLVHANASLSRAYRLFRTMGLHTLYVGQAKPLVMGVITRKDIIEENAELVLGKKAHEGMMLEGALANSPRHATAVPFIPETSGYAEYTSSPLSLDSIAEEAAPIEMSALPHAGQEVGLLSAARTVMRTFSGKRASSPTL